MRTHNLFGLDFYNGTLEESLKDVFLYLDSGADGKRLIFTPNPEMLIEASHSPHFDSVLKAAWMRLPDGTGILWAFRFLHKIKLRSRITGVDFITRFLEENKKHKVFLLGGVEGVADQVKNKYIDSNIVGTSSGSSSKDAEESLIKEINESGAEVLFVAFGAPTQEEWLHRNISKMPSVRLGMGVGGSFDFIVGKQKRAPVLYRTLGIEWLWRLQREPKRFGRIFNAVVKFPLSVIKMKFF